MDERLPEICSVAATTSSSPMPTAKRRNESVQNSRFLGNPTILKQQLELHYEATAASVAIVPDCGLAPGFANVLAAGLIEGPKLPNRRRADPSWCPPSRIDWHPWLPAGFLSRWLDQRVRQPSEIIEDGVVTTIDPLTRFEEIDWVGDGLVLEAFATAGVRNDVSGVRRSHRSSRVQDPALPRPRPDDLIGCGRVGYSGAAAMHSVAPADLLMTELSQVGIQAQVR
ncbi:MAG: hypothetical protein GY788_29975 [bacterium]|nr:hypothetical protein [bacterium]